MTITKRGLPAAVVVSPETYESLVATIELLGNPEARIGLGRSPSEPHGFVTLDEAERLLRGDKG